jgi:hypothetical protein
MERVHFYQTCLLRKLIVVLQAEMNEPKTVTETQVTKNQEL